MSDGKADFITFPVHGSDFSYAYVGVIWRNGSGNVYDAETLSSPAIDPASVEPLGECEFAHTRADFDELLAMDEDQRDDLLLQWFIHDINDSLVDPFGFNLNFEEQELQFTKGSESGLERLVRLFVLTDPEIIDMRDGEIIIASGDTEELDNHLSENSLHTKRLEQLVEIASDDHCFTGMSGAEYNDGAHDQLSGFSYYDLTINYDVANILATATARERMKAAGELAAWLTAKNVDISEFLPQKRYALAAVDTAN